MTETRPSPERGSRLYIGWRGAPSRVDLLKSPTAPANYKDPDKIREYIQKETLRQQVQLPFVPGVAFLQELRALDGQGKPVFHMAGHRPGELSKEFIRFLEKWMRHDLFMKIFAL